MDVPAKSRISLEDDVVRFSSGACGSWTMRVGDIRLVGEATNQNGPLAEDWFLCLAADATGWVEAPMDAEGRDGFLTALGKRLGTQLSPELALSTDFASRILWPPSVRGEPMFSYTDAPPKSLVWRLIGIGEKRQTFSEAALRVLE
jgi:hypothetical protein